MDDNKTNHLQRVVTSGFILNNENQFLIVKRSDNDNYLPGKWELPGGKTEYGEMPTDALKREIHEECGLGVAIDIPLVITSLFAEKHNPTQYFELFYLCTLNDNSQNVKLSNEHSDFAWITFNDIHKYEFDKYISKVLKEIKIHPFL